MSEQIQQKIPKKSTNNEENSDGRLVQSFDKVRIEQIAKKYGLVTKEQEKEACRRAVQSFKNNILNVEEKRKNRDQQEIRCLISRSDSETIDRFVSSGLVKSRKVFFYNALVYYAKYIQETPRNSEYARTSYTIVVKKKWYVRLFYCLVAVIKIIIRFLINLIKCQKQRKIKKRRAAVERELYREKCIDCTAISKNRSK